MRYAIAVALVGVGSASAGEVSVIGADFDRRGEAWQVSVTLRHDDSGWEHYADAWRVRDENGQVFATRTLHHPHVEEQPFTRSLSSVRLPAGGTVYIEGHDKVHGWSEPLAVDLGRLGASQ